MIFFKCKMCGGDLNISGTTNIVECEYCGTTQTIPSLDSEKKLNLFNRANRLRFNSEFDKAAAIYENIIAEFPEEAEAYWGLCLCNYGIEYVDDPLTARKIPTCHRASFQKISETENFALAMEYADVIAQGVYRSEAREIDRITQEIVAISKSESPYDVFICYKETDEAGARTIDSVLAQDIYDALTAKGMKVFFARISLEDKLGKMYEPYIFAALNSAKVMLVIGTKYERFNAVWVKNEWSRFLKLMAKDKSKALIPCYKDMDAYDIPDEFRMLQAQDMSKLGFMQDLVRGVEKLAGIQPPPVQPQYVQPQQVQRVLTEKEKRQYGPSLIQNVCSIGCNDPDECWPKGVYSNVLNFDQHSVVVFHLSVKKAALASKRSVTVGFKIFNDKNVEVFDDVFDLDWQSNYDKIAKGWILKGDDGTFVPVGNYCAEFWIEDSRVFEYYFTVVSSEQYAIQSRAQSMVHNSMPNMAQNQAPNAMNNRQPYPVQPPQVNITEQRMRSNLCLFCGGQFKYGLFSTKCQNCGRPKNY